MMGKSLFKVFFIKTQSFGEPPLFVDIKVSGQRHDTVKMPYLWYLPKARLYSHYYWSILKYIWRLLKNLAKRLHYKAIIASEISSQEPEHRVLSALSNYLK